MSADGGPLLVSAGLIVGSPLLICWGLGLIVIDATTPAAGAAAAGGGGTAVGFGATAGAGSGATA